MAIKRGVTKVPEENTTSTTGTTTPTNTTTTNVNNSSNASNILPEYQGAGVNKSNSYVNQGEGNYTYNEKTGFYEKTPTTPTTPTTTTTTTPEVRTGETKVTSTTTPTTPTTPETSTTKTTDYGQAIRDAWDKKTYAEQQELLKNNPNMLNELAKYGATPKEAEVKEEKPEEVKTGETKGWDYQDNSPERMSEIADNVNKFAVTDPQLFTDEDTFRNFFIDGKGRTPEQEKFLMDFYKNRKMYNKLDTYTSDQIGSMYVNGEIPDSYLTYLKNTDPERYNFVMDAKAKATDNITNQSEMDSLSYLSGDKSDKETMWGDMIEWLKSKGFLVDKNGDLIDDRRYHEASEEERTYAKEYSDNLARIMELQQTKRDMYDDYIAAYPGATKATILALVNDATVDIQKEIDNLTVENTRLQGYISYEQNERQQMDKAGADTISQLQKDYGMYYTYSPQGIREQLEAQYEATNYGLDEVETGTDTQKKIALDQILTEYYDKYGSIIQRPKAQVIMDIMDYAKRNGVSLKQALQENFVKPLQQKPEYNRLTASEPYTVKVGDVLYQYDFDTGEFTPINATYGQGYGTGVGGMRTERNNNPTAMITAYAKQLGGIEGVDYVQGDSFTSTDENGNTHTYYTAKLLGDPIEKTIELLDRGVENNVKKNVFSAWSYASDLGMTNEKWKNMSREEKEALILKMLQHEGGDINKMSYYNQGDNAIVNEQNSKFGNLSGWNSGGYLDNFEADYEAYLKSPKDYDKSDIEARYAPLGMSWYDFTSQATNYNKTGRKEKVLGDAKSSLEAAVALYDYIGGNSSISWKDALGAYMGALQGNLGGISNLLGGGDKQAGLLNWAASYTIPQSKQRTARGYFNSLNARQTLDKLIDTKDKGATYGSMTEGEWDLLRSASNLLDRSQSGDDFKKNLEDLIYGLQLSIVQGGGELPRNFSGSSAQNMVVNEVAKGRWDEYKNKQATTTTTETQQGETRRF